MKWVGIFQVGIFRGEFSRGEFDGWEFSRGDFPRTDEAGKPNLLKKWFYFMSTNFMFSCFSLR